MQTRETISPWKKALVFTLTFFCYVGLHSIRTAWSYSKTEIHESADIPVFYFGICDAVYLLSYSAGLAILSMIMNKMPLNWFIGLGMILASLSFSAMAIAYVSSHQLNKVLLAFSMGFNGFFQGTGWPGIMTAMSNWFGKGKRGMLLAIWSINANVGNIVGSVGCSIIQKMGQPWTTNIFFAVILTISIGCILILFLKPKPNVELSQNSKGSLVQSKIESSEQVLIEPPQQKPITIFNAFLIPRVPMYVISYSMIKACVNGLLFWLPTYLDIKDLTSQKAYISSMNDIGTFIGGVAVGYLGDIYKRRALFLSPLLFIGTILMLFVWKALGTNGIPYYFFIFGIGLFAGGPYQIIGSAIAIDLGQHPSLKGQQKAVSVISALIEGCAAIMSAISLLVIPLISLDWLFIVFFIQGLISSLMLAPLFIRDLQAFLKDRKQKTSHVILNQEKSQQKRND